MHKFNVCIRTCIKLHVIIWIISYSSLKLHTLKPKKHKTPAKYFHFISCFLFIYYYLNEKFKLLKIHKIYKKKKKELKLKHLTYADEKN